ncbi:hypothetical protein BH20ACI1_BH20ACI1_04440 [soil metagenome]
MKENISIILSQKISIPSEVWEWNTDDLSVSVRLWHVLRRLDIHKLGDLHEECYEEIFYAKNCGSKTIIELYNFITQLQSADSIRELANLMQVKKMAKSEKCQPETIYIPQEVRGLPLSSFSFSTRLTKVLRNLDFRLLGDLHGFPLDKLEMLRNCGSQTASELKEFVVKIQRGEFQTDSSKSQMNVAPMDLNLAELIKFIERFLTELTMRDQEILTRRFGGISGKPLTLEEIGGQYEVTRERIRQIQSQNLKNLKNRLGQAGEKLFEQLNRECLETICPMTPQLLVFLTRKNISDFRFVPSFYVRLLAELAPEIPILPEGQIIAGKMQSGRSSKICQETKALLIPIQIENDVLI